MSYPIGPGVKLTVSERGWPWPPFTACRFAVIAQIAKRMGYQVPLARQPEGAPNFVHDLQVAGDNTPHNGSTMAQGQKAIRKLLPNATFLFGTISDAELTDAVTNKGATVGFAVNCAKLPHYLKNFVGFGYTGGHYMAIDGVYADGTVDLSDPMYRPAREAKPRRVPFADVSPAIMRNGAGEMFVTMGFADTAGPSEQVAALNAQIAALLASIEQQTADLADAQAAAAALQAQLASVKADLATRTAL